MSNQFNWSYSIIRKENTKQSAYLLSSVHSKHKTKIKLVVCPISSIGHILLLGKTLKA